MRVSRQLSPTAAEALQVIRALRRLTPTSGSTIAETKILNKLNFTDLTSVALALQADEEEAGR
jgi:hypothetical protein